MDEKLLEIGEAIQGVMGDDDCPVLVIVIDTINYNHLLGCLGLNTVEAIEVLERTLNNPRLEISERN